ncbi:MAG: response regulator transcription factor [Actinomycetes bacterium]
MKVLIVDDQALIRDGLATICEHLPDVHVVGTAGDGEEAIKAVAERAPDVVLMDLRMPRMDGITATRAIRERHPDTHVVVLTTYSDDESITTALAAGALGYLTKDAGRDDIQRALHAAARGQALLDPTRHTRLVQLVPTGPTGGKLPDGLTVREAEVLGFIARGMSNQDIASCLFVSEATVKTHVNHIFAKTRSRDRGQAIAYAPPSRSGLTAHVPPLVGGSAAVVGPAVNHVPGRLTDRHRCRVGTSDLMPRVERDAVGRALALETAALLDELGERFGVGVGNVVVADHGSPPARAPRLSRRALGARRAVGP